MANYADENTPYTFCSGIYAALRRLTNYTTEIFEWFHKNRFKSNVDKCNLITSSKSQE